MPFRDRRHAGEVLASLLMSHAGEQPIVLGLARGGVPIAAVIARALSAPLDVFVARKVGSTENPEYGIGAVAPGVMYLDVEAARKAGMSPGEADQRAHDEMLEMERRLVLYRGAATPPVVTGKTVILVDDGLATGVTARAALRSLRAQNPARLILAVPVAAPDAVDSLRLEADEIVVAEVPDDFSAVGAWYADFRAVEDEDVLAFLAPASRPVRVPAPGGVLAGELTVPVGASGVVLFAHGSGSGRASPRNRAVADRLAAAGLGSLLIDLVRPDEESREAAFDVALLGHRVSLALQWLREEPTTCALPVGLFGSSTGAAAALLAAAQDPSRVGAIVSRGGRPDLAREALADVVTPTLLLVGGEDRDVLALNEEAYELLQGQAVLKIIPGATHLFEEPGAMERVAELTTSFFADQLSARAAPARPAP